MIGDSDNPSGTLGFLVGIVVLVFAGIFFSLLVDKRFRFSSGRASLEQAVHDQQRLVEKMEFRREAAREQWKKVQPFEGQAEEIQAAGEVVRSTRVELAALRERRKALDEGVFAVEEAFRTSREQYRKQARLAAAGEELGELSSRSGRTYQGVTISRVTSAGMEIRHSQGISRLRPEDLGDSWQERFQWHPEEHAKPAMEVEEPEATGSPAVVATVDPPVSPEEQAERAAAKKLASLRRDVSESSRFLDKAEAELARTRDQARNNGGVSVPGSLETWADKIRRLESTVAKFRAQYLAARGKLAAIAPDDPLLRSALP